MSGGERPRGHETGAEVRPIPKVVTSRPVYAGRAIKIRVDEISLPQGGTATREVVEHAGAVVVVPVDRQERVYLVRQYRHAISRHLLELPAGCLEAGEEPLAGAKRELREEVGLEAREWKALGSFYSSPGFADEVLHAFLARDLVQTVREPDYDEDLTVERRELQDLLDHVDDIADAKTLAALLLLARDPDYGNHA
jgi:8-oxo-dGTP pyrophosphatase MutT (NUDIX family)